MKANPTTRFSNRVSNYIKYRPGYPESVVVYLTDVCKLKPGSKIADVGSGTGIFSKILLDAGFNVYGVEPNDAMRQAAEDQLVNERSFISVNAAAEITTLPHKSMDLVVSAQAFHWFDPLKARAEFKRILIDEDQYIALIWNNRLTDTDDFAKAYEKLLDEKATDYKEINHQNLNDVDFKSFFRDGEYSVQSFPNVQTFDLKGLLGRAFSSSYVPLEITPAGEEFTKLLTAIFNETEINGQVNIHYRTEVYLGRV